MKLAEGTSWRGERKRQFSQPELHPIRGKRLVCDLDEETMNELRARARKEKTSVSQQIRLLIEWGLMAADEAGNRRLKVAR